MEMKQQRRAWIRWLAGPVVWTVYFMAVYLLVEAACELVVVTETAVFPITLVLTVITLALIAAAGYQSWHSDRDNFANKGSIFLNALFFFLTLAVIVSVWVLTPC